MNENKIVDIENIEGKAAFAAGKPTYKTIKDENGAIIDYQDVKIEGYANTFQVDRKNDQSIPGCFLEGLPEYKNNPILFYDHDYARGGVGKATSAYEDQKGLKVKAELSNAPDVKDLRFKVVEGVIQMFSIGGIYTTKKVGKRRILKKIELFEISLVNLPMNTASKFVVKSAEGLSQKQVVESEIQNADSQSCLNGTVAEDRCDDSDKLNVEDKNLYIVIDGIRKKIV